MGIEVVVIMAVALGGMYLLTGKQRKQQKEAMAFRANLAPGQYVMTGSGLFGTIVAVDDEAVVLEVSPGVTTRWLRPAVAKLAELPVPADGLEDDDELEDDLADDYDDEAYDEAYDDEADEAYDDELDADDAEAAPAADADADRADTTPGEPIDPPRGEDDPRR